MKFRPGVLVGVVVWEPSAYTTQPFVGLPGDTSNVGTGVMQRDHNVVRTQPQNPTM